LRFPLDFEKEVKEFSPQLCGISSIFTADFPTTCRLSRKIKEINPDIFVFVGGHHPSLVPEDFFLKTINAIVTGEGEKTTSELIEIICQKGDLSKVKGLAINTNEGQIRTPPRPLIKDLDNLPFPSRSLVTANQKRYRMFTCQPVASLETTRGCPFRCKFCSVWVFYQGKVRKKVPKEWLMKLPK